MSSDSIWDPRSLRIITRNEIVDLLDKEAIIQCLEEAFAELGNQDFVNPVQSTVEIKSDGGDTIFYPGAFGGRNLVGVTVSPYLLSRASAGLNPVTSFTLLVSTLSGLPVALIESEPLIEARTAATTALAVKLLSSASENRLSIVGSGPIARAHLEYALHIRKWKEVRIFSPSLVDEDSSKRNILSEICPQVKFSKSLRECFEEANVILLCTSSAEPIFNLESVPQSVLITSTTTSGSGAHDVPWELLLSSDVYCDSRETTPKIAGEMILASALGGWVSSSIRGDLGELMTGRAHAQKDGLRYFRSVGIGTEEVAASSVVLDHLVAES
jgi:L-arginine dehydrogenase